MYHRFNESKYPSTNIQMDVFKKHIDIVKESNFNFSRPEDLKNNFDQPRVKKEILITIDDAYTSFYRNAWPYLKENKIPFILFVSTEPVGKNGYMSWDQIREIEKANFAMIGHHSHSHDYLIDKTYDEFLLDMKTADKIFLEKIGYIPPFFSYPFGEYSKLMKDYISQNFVLSFGQHSGVIDINKERFELPRFPINENYGKIERFKSIIKSSPLEYMKLLPIEKKLTIKNNPPEFKVEFFDKQKNLRDISCYSNEGGIWKKSVTKLNKNILTIKFREPFLPRRGRINCSLNDKGKWRWFGTQFVIIK